MDRGDDNHDVRIRRFCPGDLPFADALRGLVGWNQTQRDWQRFMACAPEGCFLAEYQGSPAGTATTVSYGTDLGWIGMVLVHPDWRRRGVGAALLRHALRHLESGGVRCVRLDATPQGQPVYERLGFEPELSLTRWECRSMAPMPAMLPYAPTTLRAGDLDELIELDVRAFGASRHFLLTRLMADSLQAVLHRGREGLGYGMARAGSRAVYLGPVVASRPEIGVHIAQHLLAQVPGHPVFWDILEPNVAAVRLAQEAGFNRQRHLLRMRRGPPVAAGDSEAVFAIAGPEVG